MQKRIIDTLNQRNQHFARIVEQASEFTYRMQLRNGEPVYESVSEEFPVFTGISPETARQEEGYRQIIHEDDQEKAKEHYKRVLQGKSCTCTYRISTADGGYTEVVDYAKPEWDHKNESVVCICGAVSLTPKEEPVA